MEAFKSPVIIMCCLIIAISAAANNRTPKFTRNKMDSKEKQMNFLKKYGYMGEKCPDEDMQTLTRYNQEEAFIKAVRMYQKFYGLEVTGVVDDVTTAHMEKSRCGNPDLTNSDQVHDLESNSTRSRRFVILPGGGWRSTQLTYRVAKNINTGSNANELVSSQVDALLAVAFNEWAKVTPLTFTRVSSYPDIDVRFELGAHGDGDPFDGMFGTLAHASSPYYGGDIHFDDAEIWTHNIDTFYGISFFLVAVHEIGHALGLDHSQYQDSIMYAEYAYTPESSFQLHFDDVNGIQYLYGENTDPSTSTTSSTTTSTTQPTTTSTNQPTTTSTNQPTTTSTTQPTTTSTSTPSSTSTSTSTTESTPPTSSTTPASPAVSEDASNFCEISSIDAAFTDEWGYVYFLKGDYVGVLDDYLLPGYPRLISAEFPNLPSDVDAALSLPNLYNQYCWFWGRKKYCYRRYLVESARIYFFKGESYYMYSDDLQYLESGRISNKFPGIPTPIDAATSVDGLNLHFMKGTKIWQMSRQNRVVSSKVEEISSLGGLPDTLDAVLVTPYYQYNFIYLFKGNQYYRITDGTGAVDNANPPYPRLFKPWWFGCSTSSMIALQDSSHGDIQAEAGHGFNRTHQRVEIFVDQNGELVKDFELASEEDIKMHEAMVDNGANSKSTVSCTQSVVLVTLVMVLIDKWCM